MKLFKDFKTKKQLKAEIEELKRDYDDLKEDYELQKKKLSGERVCSVFCQTCKNGLKYKTWTGTYYDCLLNCRCKDFERKESEG